MWQFPADTPLLGIFPALPWSSSASGIPELDSEKLRGFIACAATAEGGTCLDIMLGTHVFNTTALAPLRVLLEAGISREPVYSIQQWERRVAQFVEDGRVELAKLRLSSADFVTNCLHPQATPSHNVSNKLLWLQHISFNQCVKAHSSKRAVVWGELAVLVGDISTEVLQATSSKAAVMAWSIVKSIVEVDAAVKSNVLMCERAAATERTATYQCWAEPLAVNLLNFWQRSEWPVELFTLQDSMVWRSSEVSWRVQFCVNPDPVIAAKMSAIVTYFPQLQQYEGGAGSAFMMETMRTVVEYMQIPTTQMQRVRDVAVIVASFRKAWEDKKSPRDRLAALLEALADEKQRKSLLKQASKHTPAVSGGSSSTTEVQLHRFNDNKQWSNLLQGDASRPFVALVAKLEELVSQAEPDGVRIMELSLRGAEGSAPVHVMQLYILQDSKATPLVHVAFANVAPYKIYKERYLIECLAYPDGGGELEPRVMEHTFSGGFLPGLLKGDVDSDKVDECHEAERLEAIKMAEYREPKRVACSQRYMSYTDYDVGPPFLSHTLKAIGYGGTDPAYRLLRVATWCKNFVRPVLTGPPAVLNDHLNIAKNIWTSAKKAMARHIFVVRPLGPLDVGELQHQVPPSALVWQMIKDAEAGMREGVRLRAHNPSLARAADGEARAGDASERGDGFARLPRDGGTAHKGSNNQLNWVRDEELTAAQLEKRKANRGVRQQRKVKKTGGFTQSKLSWKDGRDKLEKEGGEGKGKGEKSGRGRGGPGWNTGRKGGGEGKGGKGSTNGGKGAEAGTRIKASWDGPGTMVIDGKKYAIASNDGSGRSINDVLELEDPLCWAWACKKGACMKREHALHQGEDAVAHAKVTDKHRELVQQYFLVE
jgi:hypothetical protein